MVEEENEVYDNEAAEGGEDEDTMADEVDDDSENDDQEADEGTGEEEEDTGVGKVANSLGGEDDSDDDEDVGGGTNDEDEEGMEVEDDESGSNGEDDEGMEGEDEEGGSNDEDDEGTEDEDEEGENYDEDDEGTEDEEDPSESMHAPLTDRKKGDFEIFVSRLDKKTVEDDLQEAFAPFGEIQTVRIMRHPVTQKSKGFAFIRYAAAEHAKKALSELKDGAEVVHQNPFEYI